MRGFPLLNTLLVLVGFSLAWWPLHQSATGNADAGATPASISKEVLGTHGTETSAVEASVDATLKIFSSAPLASLRVETLGETLIEFSSAPENGKAIEKELTAFALPREGVEFWVEATFAERSENTEGEESDSPAALGIELAPTDRDPRSATLWTDEFDSTSVADSVVFTWES